MDGAKRNSVGAFRQLYDTLYKKETNPFGSASVPIAHPNVAYGLTMIAWTSILFVIQLLLLLLLLFFGKNKFNLLIPLIVPCLYELSILDVYPKRSFVWLFMLLTLYICYYFLIKHILTYRKRPQL